MLAGRKRFEDLVQMLYPTDAGLPPLWQVIYQEGIRSNHILFDRDEVDQFIGDGLDSERISSKESDAVCSVAMDVLRSSDLSAMRDALGRLTLRQKRTAFFLYLNAIRFWQDHLKRTLN